MHWAKGVGSLKEEEKSSSDQTRVWGDCTCTCYTHMHCVHVHTYTHPHMYVPWVGLVVLAWETKGSVHRMYPVPTCQPPTFSRFAPKFRLTRLPPESQIDLVGLPPQMANGQWQMPNLLIFLAHLIFSLIYRYSPFSSGPVRPCFLNAPTPFSHTHTHTHTHSHTDDHSPDCRKRLSNTTQICPLSASSVLSRSIS